MPGKETLVKTKNIIYYEWKMDQEKILLVEDDKLIREIYIFTLQKANYSVLSAVDGQEGIETALANPDIKLILLDVIMPGMDGVEALKRLKSDSRTQNIPVLLLSNLSDEKTVEEAIVLGAYGFVVKSQISQMELVNKVKEVIDSSK
jgi:two-component system, OmpR family, alkaline phosphatase synthesis response regulator PhoP